MEHHKLRHAIATRVIRLPYTQQLANLVHRAAQAEGQRRMEEGQRRIAESRVMTIRGEAGISEATLPQSFDKLA
jgi:hypothetical protein